MTEPTALLEVEDLVATYPVRRGIVGALLRRPERFVRAVDGVSFSLRKGEMLALVGESGCGKTTTAQTILQLVPAVSGRVALDGTDLATLPPRELQSLRRRMQMIYQDPYESLDPRFRVRQTIEEPLLIHHLGDGRSGREERVIRALESVELSPPELYADRYPHELSGGQRQRAAIAASLVLDPELLLADEPVSMLDVSVRAGLLGLLNRLRRDRDMAILMITHDLSTAAHFADRIAVMYLGRIVEQGPSEEIVGDPRHPYTRALLSVVPKRDPRNRTTAQILEGETPDPMHIPPGCRFHPRCPIAEARCRETDPALRVPGGMSGAAHEVACILA
ncbi:MAG: ABC transporter ATP-binding protein [Actinomycetota bacterium]